MNANHTRPLMAFWLLALAAALITLAGLATDRGASPGGSPSPVSHSSSPEPVAGG